MAEGALHSRRWKSALPLSWTFSHYNLESNSKFISTFSKSCVRPNRRTILLLGKKLSVRNIASDQQKELEGKLLPDSASIAASIKHHSEFAPFFPLKEFELPKAFYGQSKVAPEPFDLRSFKFNAGDRADAYARSC